MDNAKVFFHIQASSGVYASSPMTWALANAKSLDQNTVTGGQAKLWKISSPGTAIIPGEVLFSESPRKAISTLCNASGMAPLISARLPFCFSLIVVLASYSYSHFADLRESLQ